MKLPLTQFVNGEKIQDNEGGHTVIDTIDFNSLLREKGPQRITVGMSPSVFENSNANLLQL